MSIVYLNGQYLPKEDATLSVEDRGFMLGDGVYEVVSIYNRRPFALQAHLQRMRSSLEAIRLPIAVDTLADATAQLIQRNQLTDASVYWQVTRGPAPRHHTFPRDTRPTVLATASPTPPLTLKTAMTRGQAILEPDQRWANNAIKSIMLLPSVLARQKAAEAGAIEAILHRDGRVTEGAATSVFAVIDEQLRTHPADGSILAGVTRQIVLDLARSQGLTVREEAFTLTDLAQATELFITGTTSHLSAITQCQQTTYTDHPVTQRLHQAFIAHVLAQTGRP